MQKEADLQQSWKSAVSAAWGWSSYSLAAYSSADMHVMLWVVPWEHSLAEWCLPERPLPPTSVNYALQIYHHIFSTQVSFMVLKMSFLSLSPVRIGGLLMAIWIRVAMTSEQEQICAQKLLWFCYTVLCSELLRFLWPLPWESFVFQCFFDWALFLL